MLTDISRNLTRSMSKPNWAERGGYRDHKERMRQIFDVFKWGFSMDLPVFPIRFSKLNFSIAQLAFLSSFFLVTQQ